jgi:hypothetical protein
MRRGPIVISAVIALFAVGATGCRRTLFTEPTPRNQFVTFDQMQGMGEPLELVDEYGRRSPNLRYRLQGSNR